jgi:hypothetical protein
MKQRHTVGRSVDMEDETVHPRVRELLAVPQPAQRTEEWFEMRRGMLTASDLAAAIHLNPYESQFDLLLKKCNIGKRFEGNAATAVSLIQRCIVCRWMHDPEPLGTVACTRHTIKG